MNKIIKLIIFLICFIFLISYIIYETGYYEYKLQNKTILTNEQIKQFEKDVNEGKDVTLNDYIIDSEIDYKNNLTNMTIKVSSKVNIILKKSIELVFKSINKMVSE